MSPMQRALLCLFFALLAVPGLRHRAWAATPPAAPPAASAVIFPARDGWKIHADLYGSGRRGVVLVHGGRLTKDSWAPQARVLVEAGFRVLAIDMRGFGQSKEGPPKLNPGAGSPLDVLAAVRYLRTHGARTVSIVGASMGADAAAGASIEARPGEIDRLVLLAGGTGVPPEKLKGRKLFLVAKDDANDDGPRLPKIRTQYERAKEPKKLVILDGSAHAQFLFATDQGERLMREILRFLGAR
jgi:pimeloyl-ACP methyl ester carboxylesterase